MSIAKSYVLCVDDDPRNLLALKAVLANVGANLVMARSGAEALEAAGEREFAVILLDVMMPDMDGIETAKRLRELENAKHSPIVFVTAYPLDEMRTFRGYALGAVDYIHKPIGTEILQSKVRAFVQLFELREQVKEQAINEMRQRWETMRLREEFEREALLHLFVDNVKDYGVFFIDPEGGIHNWNPACESIFGYQESEILGRDFSTIFVPEDVNKRVHLLELEKAKEKGRAEDERWHLRKDGTRFWADGVVTPLRDKNGELRGFCKLVRDNTRRKEWEETLKRSEDRFRMAVDSARLGTWDYDPKTGSLEWSDRAKELAGLPENSTVTYETFLASLHPEDRPRVEQRIAEALSGKADGQYAIEYRTVGLVDKIMRWLYVRGKVYTDEQGLPTRFIGTVMDITDEKRAEEERTALIDSLKGSNRELESFASTASHDLQEPLRMISMYLSLLERRFQGRLGEDEKEYMHSVVNASDRMKRLTTDLLSYSRLFGEKIDSGPVDLNSALEKALENLSLAIEESGARITRDRLPMIRGNGTQLVQLFQNLISNAIKYQTRKSLPEISISAMRQDQQWIIAVKDNGIGFDMEHSGKIFDVFQRLHSRTEYAGSGLGLSTCRKIVEHHQGRIWAESAPADGSTFYVALPVSE